MLGEIAQGKSNAAIGESLVLTKRAVEKHINAIFLKLDLSDAGDVSKRVKAALLFSLRRTGMANVRPDIRTRRGTGAYTPGKTRAGAIVQPGRLRV